MCVSDFLPRYRFASTEVNSRRRQQTGCSMYVVRHNFSGKEKPKPTQKRAGQTLETAAVPRASKARPVPGKWDPHAPANGSRGANQVNSKIVMGARIFPKRVTDEPKESYRISSTRLLNRRRTRQSRGVNQNNRRPQNPAAPRLCCWV